MSETDGELTAVWLVNPSDAAGFRDGTFCDRPIVWDEGVPPGWTRMAYVDRPTLDRTHRCDERCVCPLDGKPTWYAPSTGQHACQDPECENAHPADVPDSRLTGRNAGHPPGETDVEDAGSGADRVMPS